ncbi:sulfite exporter TauE/SafE family protein [Desulfobacterota bacterium M19]
MLYAIFLLAGFTQGVSGFGSALIAMPLLTSFLTIKTAVPLCVLNSLIITTCLSLQLRRHINWRRIFPLLAGCLPGIVFGLLVLKHVPDIILQISLGLLVILYAAYNLFGSAAIKIKVKLSTRWAYAAGFCTGGISASLGAGGPPTIIYVTMTGWTNDEIKAALSIFFLITSIFTALGQAASGLTTPLILHDFIQSAPFTLLGVWAGVQLYNRINRQTYIRIMFWLLLVMGGVMLLTAF